MDKTAQDSLAKKPVDMRDRILEHLEALTSAVSLDDLARLSFDAEVFFLGLVLPFSLFIQRAHRQQDMGMGIVSGRMRVMDGSIGAHSVCHKLLLDEILQELDLFLSAQFYGQRRHKFTGEAAVLCGFGFLHGVPQGFPILPLCGGCLLYTSSLPPSNSCFCKTDSVSARKR